MIMDFASMLKRTSSSAALCLPTPPPGTISEGFVRKRAFCSGESIPIWHIIQLKLQKTCDKVYENVLTYQFSEDIFLTKHKDILNITC